MSEQLLRSWTAKAHEALSLREGQSIEPVLEALAGALALDVTGLLSSASSALRGDLRRLGQRTLLAVGGERARIEGDDPDELEDRREALDRAVSLAREGMRVLGERSTGVRASERPAAVPVGAPVDARDLARLAGGRIELLEAASIARRVRAHGESMRSLGWLLRPVDEVPRLRLAAADGELMRDPADGRALATVSDPESGAIVVEIFGFADGSVAAYAALAEPIRLESPRARTELMQPGYWSGRLDAGDGPVTVHVGERSFALDSLR